MKLIVVEVTKMFKLTSLFQQISNQLPTRRNVN